MGNSIRQTIEDLRAIGAPDFFERNTEVLKERYKLQFEAETGRTLYPAQTEMFVVEMMAYAHSLYNEAAQLAAEQNTVVFAEGDHLANKGADVSTYLLLAQKAVTTIRFSLTEARTQDVNIPEGTRVSAGGPNIFVTDRDCVIAVGEVHGMVTATAFEAGRASNDLPVGSVKTILDPVAYVTAASNLAVTSGGSDNEEKERFRLRVANALEKIAKTGTRGGYREFVKEVHPDIVDVNPHRFEPGVIHIYPLMRNGVASEEIKEAILLYLDPEVRRAMGDYVEVRDPVARDFSPTLILYVLEAVAGLEDLARQAIFDVTYPWTQSLGLQLAPSKLTSEVRKFDGVTEAEVTGLGFTDLAFNEYPNFTEWTIDIRIRPNV